MGSALFIKSLGDAFNKPDFSRKDIYFCGKTDQQIAHELIERNGIQDDDIQSKIQSVFQTYPKLLKKQLNANNVQLLPGIDKLFEELKKHEHLIHGLVTGNLSEAAKIKIEASGLDPNLFVVG